MRSLATTTLGLALALLCSTCTRDQQATLVLEFRHQLDGQPLLLDQARTTRYGQTVEFEHLRYWVSNVSLRDSVGGDDFTVPDSYYLIEQTPEHTRLTLALEVPAGRWDTIELHIGVDPEPNASLDAIAGELMPGIGMDWSWDTGYKFFRAEGAIVDADRRFVIHTGGDPLYKRLRAELDQPLALEPGEQAEITLEADVDRLFAGVDLGANPEILGGPVDSLAGKIAGNYSRMFTLISGAQRIVMQPSSPNLIDEDDDSIPSDGTPPQLSATPVDLAALACDPVPGRPPEQERSCFTPFVHALASTSPWDAGMLATITEAGTPVLAPAAGVVHEIRFTAHDEQAHVDLFQVTIRPNDDSAFFLELHNVTQPIVEVGDAVQPGDPIGQVGSHHDPAFGALAFSVVRRQELVQRLCPLRYATAEVGDALDQALAVGNAAWPDHAVDSLCVAPSLVCVSEPCEQPGDFVPAQGDVDAGRRLYASGCATCHGSEGEGDIGPPLCSGPSCPCSDCIDHATLADRIALDMPPEGSCEGECAADVAAFILHEFVSP